jgi:hypothetical protein
VKITPQSRRKSKTQNEDKDVLVLAPFNKLPKLLFENVKVGNSELQHITVRNPNDSRIEVCRFNFFGCRCVCVYTQPQFHDISLECRLAYASHSLCMSMYNF